VPSHFTANAVKPIIRRPVAVLPHPVLPLQLPLMTREQCGLPKDCFLVGCIFDVRSSLARKNPLGAVRAFRKAFADDPSKHFALKISNFDSAPDQKRRFLREITGLRNVSIHQEIFSRPELQGWLANCDVVISLHRAEGFGLVLSEAMQLGKAVVATNWSGNSEFMTPQNSALVDFKLVPARDPDGTYNYPMQSWADPDIDHAADWLRRLAESPELRIQLGTRAMGDVERTLSSAAYSHRLLKLLGEQGARAGS
jgi:glycosyltransferase involved in cell wall biosynthesis